MSITHSQPNSIINVIEDHIASVIKQLYVKSESETIAETNLESSEAFVLSVLLISDAYILNILSPLLQNNTYMSSLCEPPPLKDSIYQISLTSMHIEEFQNASFDRRYVLGCFIDPICLSLQDDIKTGDEISSLKNTHFDTQLDSKVYNAIAIRLRDLFAEQSLLLTSIPAADMNLNNLGYVPVRVKSQDSSPNLVSWQFNLYDYKQRPDWLNAKYWANPENFDKYRW